MYCYVLELLFSHCLQESFIYPNMYDLQDEIMVRTVCTIMYNYSIII